MTEAFRSSGLKLPQPKIVSFSLHLRNRLLATGRYLSVVPASLLHFGDLPSPLKVLPVDLAIEPRPVAIVTLKDRTLGPVAKLFIDCAREITKRLANAKSSGQKPSAQ